MSALWYSVGFSIDEVYARKSALIDLKADTKPYNEQSVTRWDIEKPGTLIVCSMNCDVQYNTSSPGSNDQMLYFTSSLGRSLALHVSDVRNGLMRIPTVNTVADSTIALCPSPIVPAVAVS